MLKELYNGLKEDPKEVIGSFVFIAALFGMFYAAIWIGCPC
tara:strand:- start:236 stop:358 length:123 start_codon:yes stop_codon:yes gene_type:complete